MTSRRGGDGVLTSRRGGDVVLTSRRGIDVVLTSRGGERRIHTVVLSSRAGFSLGSTLCTEISIPQFKAENPAI